jgi:hypothetical protein
MMAFSLGYGMTQSKDETLTATAELLNLQVLFY